MAATSRLEEGAPGIDELRQRANQAPDELEPQRELGWALYGLDQTDEAIEILSALQNKYPDDVETSYALGLALKRAGRKQEAGQAFQRALDNLDSIENPARVEMLGKLTRGQINLLDHGSWDIRDG